MSLISIVNYMVLALYNSLMERTHQALWETDYHLYNISIRGASKDSMPDFAPNEN